MSDSVALNTSLIVQSLTSYNLDFKKSEIFNTLMSLLNCCSKDSDKSLSVIVCSESFIST